MSERLPPIEVDGRDAEMCGSGSGVHVDLDDHMTVMTWYLMTRYDSPIFLRVELRVDHEALVKVFVTDATEIAEWESIRKDGSKLVAKIMRKLDGKQLTALLSAVWKCGTKHGRSEVGEKFVDLIKFCDIEHRL